MRAGPGEFTAWRAGGRAKRVHPQVPKLSKLFVRASAARFALDRNVAPGLARGGRCLEHRAVDLRLTCVRTHV